MTTLLESGKKIYYIGIHKQIFEIKNFYPLDIFDSFVTQIETTSENCYLESSCKIERDKLYPARFGIGFTLKNLKQLNVVYEFFQKVESRIDVQINYSLIQQFFGNDFNFNQMTEFMVGVDARQELAESKLKISLTIKDYPEKIKRAIELNGGLDKNIYNLLVSNSLHIGFDLSLDGRSEIELYPYIRNQEFQIFDIQQRLASVLSPQALQFLHICSRICVGLSKANADKVVYFYLKNINDFLNYFPVNDNARRVHAYYQQQPMREMCVAVQEKELLEGTIQKMNLYYLI